MLQNSSKHLIIVLLLPVAMLKKHSFVAPPPEVISTQLTMEPPAVTRRQLSSTELTDLKNGGNSPRYIQTFFMKILLRLSACFVISVSVVVILYAFSLKKETKRYGFNRYYPQHAIGFHSKVDLGYNSYYFAGITDNKVYLGNFVQVNKIWESSYSLKDSSSHFIQVPQNEVIVWQNLKMTVNYPNIFLSEGYTPAGLVASYPDLTASLKYSKGAKYNKAIPLSMNSAIVRTYNRGKDLTMLVKSLNGRVTDTIHSYPIDKHGDGILSSDGLMLYNYELNKLVYIYFYKNKFITLDSNLAVGLTAHTIDTINMPQIAVAKVQNGKELTMSQPPLTVNKKAATWDTLLYINSGVMAENDDSKKYQEYSTIDVYNIINGKYLHSFYIPRYQDHLLSNFIVHDKMLFVLYDRYLLSYLIKVP